MLIKKLKFKIYYTLLKIKIFVDLEKIKKRYKPEKKIVLKYSNNKIIIFFQPKLCFIRNFLTRMQEKINKLKTFSSI